MAYRRSFMIDYLRSHGLTVVGDETTDELTEAYAHMRRHWVRKGLA